MKVITNGRNIELTEAIKAYVEEKLTRIEKHYDFVTEIHVVLGVEKNPRIHDNQLAEATVLVPGAVMRLEVASESVYASIDILADKIDRSLNKHKTKLQSRGGSHDHSASIRHLDDAETETDDSGSAVAVEDADASVEITYIES